MRVFMFHELEREEFGIYSRKVQLKMAIKAEENFMIVSSSGPCTPWDNQKAIEGKKGDYIVKGRNHYFIIPEKHFERAYETLFIKEDFDNVLSFYKRKVEKDDF